MNNSVQSWNDAAIQQPNDPRILIANMTIGGIQGVFTRSTNFIGGATWVASPFSFNGTVQCFTLHTDDQQAVADAAQWNFSHKGGNFAATTPPPLRNIVYLRGGTDSEMHLTIDLGVAVYADLQVSFRDNAATAGDFTGSASGSIPVIKFSGNLTGPQIMTLTVKMYGTYILAISARDALNNWSMFEMECIVVM